MTFHLPCDQIYKKKSIKSRNFIVCHKFWAKVRAYFYVSSGNILNVTLIHVRYLLGVLGTFMVTCNTAQIYHFDISLFPCVVVSLKYFHCKIGKLVPINFAFPLDAMQPLLPSLSLYSLLHDIE